MRRVGAFAIAVVAALLPVGCGGAGPAGPRIVEWRLETDGAPPLVLGSYDRREKVHCRFLDDEQGHLRCLPSSAAALRETTAFADPTCQTQIYSTDPGREPFFAAHAVAVPLRRADCAPKRHAVATLKPLGAGATRYSGTPCTPIDGVAAANDGSLVIDRREPPETWATGTEVDGPRLAGHVRVREIQAEGGALFEDHLVDETLGKPCDVELDSSGEPVCLPARLRSTAVHGGTDCTGPAVFRAPACTDPAFIEDAGSEYAVGPQWSGAVSTVVHGCGVIAVDASTTDGPDVYYERGAQLAPFAPGVFELEGAGTGRLALRGVKGDDGSVVILDDEIATPVWGVSPRYADTIGNRDCDPMWTAEGLVRCIPAGLVAPGGENGLFADAACTIPAGFCPSAPAPCVGAPVLSTVVDDSPSSFHVVSVHEAVGVTTAFSTANAEATCQPASSPVSLFSLGGELSWELFPQLTEVNGRADDAP